MFYGKFSLRFLIEVSVFYFRFYVYAELVQNTIAIVYFRRVKHCKIIGNEVIFHVLGTFCGNKFEEKESLGCFR